MAPEHDAASQYVGVLHDLVRELRADVKELQQSSQADRVAVRNLRDDLRRLDELLNRVIGEQPTIVQLNARQSAADHKLWAMFAAVNLLAAGFIAWAANGFPWPFN